MKRGSDCWRVLILASIILSLCACGQNNASKSVLQDIVYTRGAEESEYTIQIKEETGYVPYLVLTDHYDGNCLLVRKYLLDENMKYNRNMPNGAYYADSEIDNYLQHTFSKRFGPSLESKLCDSSILITAKDSLYSGRPKTETIHRRIFLLSYSDVGGNGGRIIANEGTWLDFFKDQTNRIAAHESGKPDVWWLRTPETWYDTLVCTVGMTGTVGTGTVGGPDGEYENGIRPAFCIGKDEKIVKTDGKYYLDGFSLQQDSGGAE